MKNQPSVPSIISLFQSVEENLHKNNINLALLGVRSVLANDPQNFYAIAIERRLKPLLDLQQKSVPASNAAVYSRARIITALEHVSHMAVQQCTQPSVHDMGQQLQEQALEKKHQALLQRARQKFQDQDYERALQEAERARIVRPHSAEADSLIMGIKAHMRTPETKKVSRTQAGKLNPAQDVISGRAKEHSEAATEKILSSISFADYYRTNGDYTECVRYIAQGLDLDPSNEVLLQMKEEVEKIVRGKLPEKKTSFQFA